MKVKSIFKKEIKIYFTSPIAYVVLFIFSFLTGYLFYNLVAYYSLYSTRYSYQFSWMTFSPTEMIAKPLFHNMAITSLFILPLLTMRLFSEEKKTDTIELLFTYPLKDIDIYLGKFFACLTIFIVMLVPSAIYLSILEKWVDFDKIVLLNGYLGLILLGSSFISLGIFVSSLTENQLIAATFTFGLTLSFWLIGWASGITGGKVSSFFSFISLNKHYENFPRGILDTRDIIFYLSFSLFFSFTTLRILLSKKYRG